MVRLWLTLGVALSSPDAALQQVWTGPGVTVQGMPSADGRWLSCVDPQTGDIALRDLRSGKIRPLTGHRRGKEFAYFSAIAPDSSRVAYAWFNDAGFYELRLVSAEGGTPRVLYRNEEAGFVQPSDWTPDGKYILTLFFRKDNTSQIALVSADDGSARVLKSLNWVYPKKMDISPDGRWIVYDSFASGGRDNADIFLLAADGSGEELLVGASSDDSFPLWMPDGRSIVFASNRLGTLDAWTVAVRDGKPAGAPSLIRRDLARFLPLGITADGRLHFAQRKGAEDVFLATIQNEARPKRLASRFAGANSAPAFSREGKFLAYLTRAGAENYSTQAHAVTIRDLATGKERQIAPKLAHIERIRWSPGAEWLLASGADGKGRSGVFRIHPQSGDLRIIALDEKFSVHGIPADWRDRDILVLGGASLREHNLATGQDRVLDPRPASLVAAGPSIAFLTGRDVVVLGKGTVYRGPVTALEWVGADLLIGAPEGLLLGGRRIEVPGYHGGPIGAHGSTVAFSAGRTANEIWSLKLP